MVDEVWHRDPMGRWTMRHQGSTLAIWQLAGIWYWQAAANASLIRSGTAGTYHQAKLAARAAAEGIAQEGAD